MLGASHQFNLRGPPRSGAGPQKCRKKPSLDGRYPQSGAADIGVIFIDFDRSATASPAPRRNGVPAIVAIGKGQRPNAKAFERSAMTRSMFGSTFEHDAAGEQRCDPVCSHIRVPFQPALCECQHRRFP
jgi:hypothetical protein